MKEMKKTQKKGGRPTIGSEKLEKVLPCRLTIKEYEKVITDAQKTNFKMSELARQYITKGYVTNLFSEEEQLEKRQLIGVRNNLNQLVKLAHIGGFFNYKMEIDRFLNQIDEILERYNYVSKGKRIR
jgi:hypothetical protein